MATKKVNMYWNTLVFTAVAGVVSIMLLLLLVYGAGVAREYAYIIVTVEIGLILTILVSILRIVWYENRIEKQKRNALQNLMRVDSCPDYWTMNRTVNGPECKNEYTVVEDGTTTRFEEVTGNKTDSGIYPKKTLQLKDLNNKELKTVCDAVMQQRSPWTDLRTICDSYSINSTHVDDKTL
jgi:hypothetical protein